MVGWGGHRKQRRLNGDPLLATWLHLQATLPCLPRDGDHYDALRDCLKAISLNPCHLKAHFRLARCLFELKYVAEALECLDDFKGKFPEQAHSSACDALGRDITAALFSKNDGGEWALRRGCCYSFSLRCCMTFWRGHGSGIGEAWVQMLIQKPCNFGAVTWSLSQSVSWSEKEACQHLPLSVSIEDQHV